LKVVKRQLLESGIRPDLFSFIQALNSLYRNNTTNLEITRASMKANIPFLQKIFPAHQVTFEHYFLWLARAVLKSRP
jgi:hypothetical protein